MKKLNWKCWLYSKAQYFWARTKRRQDALLPDCPWCGACFSWKHIAKEAADGKA